MNTLIEKAEVYVTESTRKVMTSHITLSVLLVFAAVALLRAFQLENKILIRGVILLFFINYVAIRTSQDYINSGKGYRDTLFKTPAPLPQIRLNAPADSVSVSSASASAAPQIAAVSSERLSNRSPPKVVKPFQEDKTFEL